MRRLLFLLPIVLAASPHRPDERSTVSISQRRLRTSIAVDSNELIDEGSSAEFEQPRSRKRARSVATAVDSSKEDAKMFSTNLHGSRTRFLKNKLLDNLNKYFGEESGALEILSSEDPAPEGSWNSAPAPQPAQPQQQQWGLPPAANPWMQPQQHPQQPFPQQQQPIQQQLLMQPPHAVVPPGVNPWLAWTTPAPFQQQQPFVPPPQQPPGIHPTLIPAPPPLDTRQQRSGPQQPLEWKAETKSRLVKQSSWEQSADRTITKTGMAGDTSGETQPQMLMTTQRVTPKKRKRGESSMNRDTMDTIRSWRNRLYKAFKRHDGSNPHALHPPTRISRLLSNNTSGGRELLEFSNQTPLVADKNLQMLKSRDPQLHHVPRHVQQQPTFGMDQNGKIAPMFGMERQGYRFTGQHPMPVEYSHPPHALYLPPSAPQQQQQPYYHTTPPPLPPAFYTTPSYYSTTAPPYTLFPPLKHNVLTYPTQPSSDGFYYKPTQSVSEPTPSPTLPTMITPPPRPDQQHQEEFELAEEGPAPERHSAMSGVTCADGSCSPVQLPQQIQEELTPINEDKCNSMRLKEIIERNIVPNDAEASKRAVQAVAEDVTGRYFDAICGTGFFSYIAHTDEFCQASSSGVNCYLFSPVCGNTQGNVVPFKKHRKRTTLLNKN